MSVWGLVKCMQFDVLAKLLGVILTILSIYTILKKWIKAKREKKLAPFLEINAKITEIMDLLKRNTEATAYLMRYRLEHNSQKYIARNGFTFTERNEIDGMFGQYFALNFNGIEKGLYHRVMALPIIKDRCEKYDL